ncbi:MAG TPA: hypothetical protein VK444_06620 [Methanobacteriaceae archaeon]|nr:hypothetical protein [Methanobacteriaceae archaeon]
MVLILGAVLISAGAVSATDTTPDQNQLSDSSSTATDTQTSINESTNVTESTPTPSTMGAAGAPPISNVKAYWVRYESYYLDNLDVASLKAQGITDLFVLTSRSNPGTLQGFITKFAGSGIRIHAWVTCFTDGNGHFIRAQDADWGLLISQFQYIVDNYDIQGLHLDYIRYSGVGDNKACLNDGTKNINLFLEHVRNMINNSTKPNTLLSAAVMPECSVNAEFYGQDYEQMARYLDFLVPMIYKGNYNKDSTWIVSTVQYIVAHSGGKPVVAGLQNYRSDGNLEFLPAWEQQNDINSAVWYGAAGYAWFRYGPGRYVTEVIATPYKYVSYRGWIRYTVWVKKRIRIARGKYRIARVAVSRYKRGWIAKWLYSYSTIGKWVLT